MGDKIACLSYVEHMVAEFLYNVIHNEEGIALVDKGANIWFCCKARHIGTVFVVLSLVKEPLLGNSSNV